MKKILLNSFLLFFASLTLFVSCASAEDIEYVEGISRIEGFFPYRHMEVDDRVISPLASSTVGTVRASATVSLYADEDGLFAGDSGEYASISYPEEKNWFLPNFETPPDGFKIALSNATYKMEEMAKTLGASFITFPSFTVKLNTDDTITVNTYATAMKIIDVPITELIKNTNN